MSEVGVLDSVTQTVRTPALRCEGITKAFQGVHAVNGASFEIPEGQITALIGPNGAGKSTVVNILSGAMTLRPRQGVHRRDGGHATGRATRSRGSASCARFSSLVSSGG